MPVGLVDVAMALRRPKVSSLASKTTFFDPSGFAVVPYSKFPGHGARVTALLPVDLSKAIAPWMANCMHPVVMWSYMHMP